MRSLLLLLLLAACTLPPQSADWRYWTDGARAVGKFRTERDPGDAPVTRQTVVGNFRRIAFEVEEFPLGKRLSDLRQEGPPHLRRWATPIRYEIIAQPEDKARIDSTVREFMQHLGELSSHSIARDSGKPVNKSQANLLIFFGPDLVFRQFRTFASQPDQSEARRAAMLVLADYIDRWRLSNSPCAGKVYESSGEPAGAPPMGTIGAAVVLIRGELPEALLQSCIEEELTQVLGLLNDDAEVRPSIFNDDMEFALLTRHDELLLRILYDDRLTVGMSPEAAMPIVERIAAELLPEG